MRSCNIFKVKRAIISRSPHLAPQTEEHIYTHEFSAGNQCNKPCELVELFLLARSSVGGHPLWVGGRDEISGGASSILAISRPLKFTRHDQVRNHDGMILKKQTRQKEGEIVV